MGGDNFLQQTLKMGFNAYYESAEKVAQSDDWKKQIVTQEMASSERSIEEKYLGPKAKQEEAPRLVPSPPKVKSPPAAMDKGDHRSVPKQGSEAPSIKRQPEIKEAPKGQSESRTNEASSSSKKAVKEDPTIKVERPNPTPKVEKPTVKTSEPSAKTDGRSSNVAVPPPASTSAGKSQSKALSEVSGEAPSKMSEESAPAHKSSAPSSEEPKVALVLAKTEPKAKPKTEPKTKAALNEAADTNDYDSAIAYFKHGDYEQAAEMFRRIAAQVSDSQVACESHHWLGHCLFGMHKHEEAIAEFEEALNCTGSGLRDASLFMIGNCYLKLKDNQKANASYARLLSDYPGSRFGPMASARTRSLTPAVATEAE